MTEEPSDQRRRTPRQKPRPEICRLYPQRRAPRVGVRLLLHPPDERPRRRSAPAQSLDAVRVGEPDFPWQRLRAEAPGVYESYVDLQTGAWTRLRIDVSGSRARLFVNGATQPALIVNDLKRGPTSGQIGLWIGVGTEAYFRGLHVTTN